MQGAIKTLTNIESILKALVKIEWPFHNIKLKEHIVKSTLLKLLAMVSYSKKTGW